MNKKRYLNKFKNVSIYESQKNEMMGIPHVVLVEDTKKVIFVSNAKDYSKEYFTIEALEEGTVGIGIPSKATSLKYRKNNEPWIETNKAIQLSVVANDTIQISCVSDTFNNNCSSLFAVSTPFNVKGNIMSLLYGDDFEGQTDLSGKYDAFLSLFMGQTTLKNAENLILPATTLASKCYYNMFYGCTSLTTAPQLPATTLANYCYYQMFYRCTSLTTAPQLPATTLAEGCYDSMFEGCTSLTTAPQLPATTLKDYCYYQMFYGCTSLTTAPELPATTLASSCYKYMFEGCTSLTTAPELPATTLANYCYYQMFYGCSKLNKITMLATDISAYNYLTNWVYGVASSGTFVKNAAMTSLPSGQNGIPEGWTVQDYYYFPSIVNTLSTPIDFNYDDGMFTPTVTVELTKIMSEENILSLQPMCDITVNVVNKDKSLHTSDYLWVNTKTLSDVMQELNISNINDIAIVIVDADIPEDNGFYYYYDVEETEPFVEKDWMRIVSLEDGNEISVDKNVQYSINGADWKKLNYNTITLNTNDIAYFKGTESQPQFTVSKEFNAEGNIMSLIYNNDFEGQTTLTSSFTFKNLFYETKIVSAKNLILPATTLAESCYSNMFRDCTSLIIAPQLPATTLANYCYYQMFYGCSKLNKITMLATDISASSCLYNWVNGVASSGTFIKHPDMTSLPSGASGIPNGWTVQDYEN